MFESLKRWLIRDPASDSQWAEAARWGRQRGYAFRRAKDDEGFVLEGHFDGGRGWRLEWGPPQRAYIVTQELRLRLELRLPPSFQMLVMNRSLMERLERETFERYTDSTQTQIDVTTPEEMRWLAMFPPIEPRALGAARTHFGAVAIDALAATDWFDAEFTQRLQQAAERFAGDDPPFVLMTLRGRLYLRQQLPTPEPAAMDLAIALMEAAARAALRLAEGRPADAPVAPDGATAWQNQLLDDDRLR